MEAASSGNPSEGARNVALRSNGGNRTDFMAVLLSSK